MTKPSSRDGVFEPWRRNMEPFIDLKRVRCKILGTLIEDDSDWPLERLKPYFEAIIDIFGPDGPVLVTDRHEGRRATMSGSGRSVLAY